MRARSASVVLLLVLIGALVAAAPAPASPAVAKKLFTLGDSRLDEASGLAVGRRSPDVLYAQNDSGDSARFFALDARTGRTLTVCTVPDAENVDWEDLATGPDAHGVPSVWLADIGDNDAMRSSVQVYRVPEPAIGAVGARTTVTTGTPEVWRLRYPDGAHNAETLLVDPVTHRFYIVTKAFDGRSQVFEAPASSDGGRTQTLTQVGSVTFGFTFTKGGPNALGELTATGGSMSADGSRLVIRTYTDAYVWSVRAGDVAGALKVAPVRVALPAQPLGEGIAIGDGVLLTDSEHVGSTVFQVRLPAIAVSTPARSPAKQLVAVAPAVDSGPDGWGHAGIVWVVAGLVAVLVLLAPVIVFAGRRGGRRR